MAKAVLIMDMPKGCFSCRFLRIDAEHRGAIESCGALEIGCPVDTEKYDKPDWCPLRELPERVTEMTDSDDLGVEYVRGTMDGWNACLDEILKERKE